MLQAVFIDRDGTIGGTGHFIHPRDFVLFEGVQGSLNKLKQYGIKVFAITNQHRISRGEATVDEFRVQFEQYGFHDAFICPHSNDGDCHCKKPNPGMLIEAAEKYDLDLAKCAVIGDVGSTDMLAAHAAGAKKILVRTGWGENSLTDFRHTWKDTEPDVVVDDFNEAVEWIIRKLEER